MLIASVAIVLLFPVMAIVALAIVIESGSPVIFSQYRIGKHGRVFKIYKFRTMLKDGIKPPLVTERQDPRITRVGSFLRDWKLDEIPQFLNVVMGDMSLVGPRPEIPRLAAYYGKECRCVIESVRPGLTDLSSLVFRDELKILEGRDNPLETYVKSIIPKKCRLSRLYLKKKNTVYDLRVLLATVVATLVGR